MKKTMLSLLLALSLLLSACGAVPVPTTAPVRTTAATVSTETSEPDAEPPAPENQELTAVFTADGTVSMLAGCDSLLAVTLVDGQDTAMLLTIDPVTGTHLGQAVIADPYVDVLAFSGGAATFSWNSGILEVYSPAMERLWTRTLSEGSFGNLQSDESFYLFPGDSTVVRIALADQSEQTIAIPAGLEPLDVFLSQGNRSLLRCSSEEDGSFSFLWLDWTEGTAQLAELSNSEIYLGRGKSFETIPGHEASWLRNPLQPQIYRLDAPQAWMIHSEPERVLCEADDGILTVFDLEQGTAFRHRTPGVSIATLCGDLVAYREIEQPGKVFLWNPALSQAEPNAVSLWTPEQLNAETERMACAITAHTDMPVFWGEAGTDYNHGFGTSYVSDPVTDPLTVYLGMEQLKVLTEEYPAGIFQEMCTDDFQPIEVYLSGAIRGDQYGFNPVGFTTYTGEAQIVVLDISTLYDPDSLRATIAHEFLHVMENRISQHGWDTGLDYLAYWMSFTPDPALYYFNYNDYLDYDQDPNAFTTYTDLPPEEVLFLDPYSRTRPTEDRARILEFLYPGENSTYAYALQTGVLRKKAEYLCAVIRECFPSCQIEGKLPWETLVDVVPFSEYEEAVRSYQPQAVG